MMLPRQTTIDLADFIVGRGAIHAESLVVILLIGSHDSLVLT